jgi:hypothetical protein
MAHGTAFIGPLPNVMVADLNTLPSSGLIASYQARMDFISKPDIEQYPPALQKYDLAQLLV